MRLLSPSVFAFLLLSIFGGSSLGGPNAGGVLLVHYEASASIPAEPTLVEGGLTACDDAVVQAPQDSTILWHIYAAFPAGSSPRLKVVTFGCQFDPDQVGILWSATRTGAIEIKYPDEQQWPYSGSGTSVGFFSALTEPLDEIYCFAGYGSEGELFALAAHPDSVLGGSFADDSPASMLDPIADYGSLGFGVFGSSRLLKNRPRSHQNG